MKTVTMWSRRHFLERLSRVPLVGGAIAAGAAPATAAPAAVARDYFRELGVRPFINAAGTYTAMTASLMPPEVIEAITYASKHYVMLDELHDRVGARIATLLKCEAAMVTSGAASALTLATAGILTGTDPRKVVELPSLAGMKSDVIIQKAHRFGYDHAVRNCGVRLVEVETRDEMERAITPQTAMMLFYNNNNSDGRIRDEEFVAIGRKHGVPTLNDAAADVPPVENLWKYTQMGFDLVTFSGGKGIRGPQNAGLLLGRKDLIAAAAATNNPYDEGVGRGMKVAKEQIVGMVAAVDWILGQSDETLETEFRRRADRISSELKRIPTLEAQIVVPPAANHVPHLLLRYDQQRVKIAPLQVAQQLRQGEPSIELNPATGRREGSAGLHSDENTIVVGVWMLEPGEDLIVGRRLHEVLSSAAGTA